MEVGGQKDLEEVMEEAKEWRIHGGDGLGGGLGNVKVEVVVSCKQVHHRRVRDQRCRVNAPRAKNSREGDTLVVGF